MRCVVTGGAGFLGSHLCDFLLEKGHTVVCLDNFITGRKDNIKHLLVNEQFSVIEHDVTKYIDIEGDVDRVFHLASPASPTDYLEYPIQTLKVGSLGTHNALGVAKAKGAAFLLASTSEVYGDPKVHPQSEEYWGHVNPVGHRGAYDEAKRFGEAITMAYHRVHQLDTRIVRIFNTFGPRMRINDGRALPNFMVQAVRGEEITVYGNGTQTRSFCFVSDLMDGIYRLMESDEHLPINIGNPDEISIFDLALEITSLAGSKSKVVFVSPPEEFDDDPKTRRPDITRARQLLKWEPTVNRSAGLVQTLDYFRSLIAQEVS